MIGFLLTGLETIPSRFSMTFVDFRCKESMKPFFFSLIFPRGRHESLSNVNRNTLSLYVELVHDFIVIVRIKCCI